MSTENIVIQIREDGSREVVRNIADIGTASKATQSAVDSMKNALRGIAGLLALNELRRYADTWTSVQGKVNIFTHSAQETAQVMERLYRIAQDTRQPIAATGDMYHQASIAAERLGASQEQLLTFTQSISQAFAVQGTSANTARGGMVQLGQAMTEGIVRAQEYNSMVNSMPLVLKVVANNLDGVGGSLSKLRKLMLEQKLYSRDFFAALIKGAPEMAAMFEKSGKTIGQSFIILDNAMTKYVGQIDQAYGISAKFYDLASWGAENINDVVKVMTILVSPFILQGLLAIRAALSAMALAAVANPYVALAAGLTMVATAATLYRNEIILIEKEQVSLGDYMVASWAAAKDGANDLVAAIEGRLSSALKQAGVDSLDFTTIWGVIGQTLRNILNGWIGWFAALPQLFVKVWENVPSAIGNIFITMFNSLKSQAADFFNGFADMINPMLEKANIGSIARVQFEDSKPLLVKSWSEMAGEMGDIIKESTGTDYIQAAGDALDGLTQRAKAAAKARHDAEKAAGQQIDLSGLGGGEGEDFAGANKAAEKAAKALLRLEKQLANVISAASPAEGAALKLKFAEDILEKSLQKGLLTRDEYNKYLALTREHYAEIANPLGELNKRLDEESRLLMLNARAREVETQALAARRQLMAKGANVDAAELQALRDRYSALQALSERIQAQDALLANSVEKRRAFVIQLQAIQALLADSNSGFSASDAQEALYQMAPDAFAGTDAYVDHVKKSYEDMFAQIQMMRDADRISEEQANQMRLGQTELLKQAIIQAEVESAQARLNMSQGDWADMMLVSMGQVVSGFTTMQAGVAASFGQLFTTLTDGFANSFAAAIVSGDDLGESLRNVASSAVEQLIAGLIKLGIQWAIQAALGNALGASTTAASIAMGTATAAAWAPAAAAVSLASFGSNSVPAMAGMGATFALSKGLSMAGMAHDGIDSIPEEGTWLLDKGERVVDSRTNADLKTYLANGGGSGAANPVATTSTGFKLSLVINNNASNDVAVSTNEGTDEDGNPQLEVYIDRIEESLAGRMGSGRGPLNKATSEAFGLRPNARGRG